MVAGVVIGIIAGVGIGVGAYMNSKKRAAERLLPKGDHLLVDAHGDADTLNPILEIDAHAGREKHEIALREINRDIRRRSENEIIIDPSVLQSTSSTNLQVMDHTAGPHPVIDDAKPWGEPVETPDLSPIKTPRPGTDGFDDWDAVDVIL